MVRWSKGFRLLQKIHAREIVACLLLLVGLYFFRQQQAALTRTVTLLHQARLLPLLAMVGASVGAVLLQAGMYRSAFAGAGNPLSWPQALELFLKRNLLSVFVPGGGLSALWYVPRRIQKTVDDPLKIHQASAVFALTGVLSVVLTAVPVLLFYSGSEPSRTGLVTVGLVFTLLFLAAAVYYGARKNTKRRTALQLRYPRLGAALSQLSALPVHHRHLKRALLTSLGVELCGILMLYLAMMAMGSTPSFAAAAFAYTLSILLMMASPFLKGLGAVELLLVYLLTQCSYSAGAALAITLVYRFFEFWLPLLGGIAHFFARGKKLFLRVSPAFVLLFLGIVNILSVLTPPIAGRLHWIHRWIPSGVLHVTNLFVLFIGVGALVCAAYLARGYRSAWWLAMVLSLLSFGGHLIKALDYEEALLAAGVFTLLLATRERYRARPHTSFPYKGLYVTGAAAGAVLLYGFIGFYFLQQRDFGTDFTTGQSLYYALRGFLLLPLEQLAPRTRFGAEYLLSFQVMSLCTWLFLLYYLVKPHLRFGAPSATTRALATRLLHQYSTSSNDYFKLTGDKLLFFSPERTGFIAYRVAYSFAIVLGEPVCDPLNKTILLKEFEAYCKTFGLKPVFYRVDEQAVGYFKELGKRKILIGQEGVLDVSTFSLSGSGKKSLRNALNSLGQKGYVTRLCSPPHSESLLKDLKNVSDEWLSVNKKKEIAFAQGAFDVALLEHQDLIVLLTPASQPVAFLNIVPNLAPNECTYDLIRKTADAPSGCLDALILELIRYAQGKGLKLLNLGLVPFSGINTPSHPAEWLLRYAYRKAKAFRSYQGLRHFKEKYTPHWINHYLVYDRDADLLPFIVALNKVLHPTKTKRVAV